MCEINVNWDELKEFDYEQIIKSEWYKHSDPYGYVTLVCPICNTKFERIAFPNKYRRCPWCGTKMGDYNEF